MGAAILGISLGLILILSNQSREIGLQEYWEHRDTLSASLLLEFPAMPFLAFLSIPSTQKLTFS